MFKSIAFIALSLLTFFPLSVLSQVALLAPTLNQSLTPGQSFTIEIGHDGYIENIEYTSASVILYRDGSGAEALYVGSTLLDSSVTTGENDNYSTTYTFQMSLPSTTFADATSAFLGVNVYTLVGVSLESWIQVANTSILLTSSTSASTSSSSSSTASSSPTSEVSDTSSSSSSGSSGLSSGKSVMTWGLILALGVSGLIVLI